MPPPPPTLQELEEELIPPAQQKRSREKLERMLEAGEKLLADRDYDDLKIDDICREAGCNVTSFYHRFVDKERYFAVLQLNYIRRRQELQIRLRESGAIPKGGLEQAIRWIVATTLFAHRSDRGPIRAFSRHTFTDPRISSGMVAMNRFVKDEAKLLLKPHRDRIRHPDPDVAIEWAVQLVLSTMLSINTNNPGPFELDDPRLESYLVRTLLAVLAAGQSPDSPAARE